MPYSGAGWFKMWRSGVQADMELTPHEFKLWVLLQAIVLHTSTKEMVRGSVELSYSDIRVTLRGDASDAQSYSYATLSHSLTRLVQTGRIERLTPGKGNRTRIRIKEWDLLQHGKYDAVPGRAKAGWLKVWRWGVLGEDMGLSPEEFKVWYLLLSMASHADSEDAKRTRGNIKTTVSNLRGSLSDVIYTDQRITHVLERLEETGRIDGQKDGKGVVRLGVRHWDLMQRGNYGTERWEARYE